VRDESGWRDADAGEESCLTLELTGQHAPSATLNTAKTVAEEVKAQNNSSN